MVPITPRTFHISSNRTTSNTYNVNTETGLSIHPNPEKPKARNLENIKNKKAEKRNS